MVSLGGLLNISFLLVQFALYNFASRNILFIFVLLFALINFISVICLVQFSWCNLLSIMLCAIYFVLLSIYYT